MNSPIQLPEIRALVNQSGALVLTPCHAPADAVIRWDINADTPRVLCTQGAYLAPIQAPPGTRVRYRLFSGKRGITEAETFIMPGSGEMKESPIPSTLIPCTQNRDFQIYDWPARHDAVCRLVRETHPELLFIGDSITHFWGGLPEDTPTRDLLQKSPESWNACTAGLHAANLGFGYDRVENALWRLRHGELDGAAQDAVCVLLIGTNNLTENTDEEILQGIRAVCDEILDQLRRASLIVQGFYPRNHARKGSPERIANINAHLSTWAQEAGFLYTEPGKVMADASGVVPAELSEDGLHPSALGYQRIAAVLAPVIRQALENRKK